jgi:ribonuclease P protein component
LYARYMLGFKYRFHGHGSLRYVYAHGDTVRTRLMTLRYTFHPKRENPRIAVVVSKKVLKRAVGRNRIRRRLYEAVRHEIPHLKHNTDLAIIVFSAEVLDLTPSELVQTIRQIFEGAGVYKNDQTDRPK